MASALQFIRRGSGDQQTDTEIRYSLRRVTSLLHRFFKVFQINLDRMKQHKVNIQKFLVSGSIPQLTKEYVYTLQSVSQLTVTVEQISQLRSQVETEDLAALDEQLVDLFNDAILLLAEFMLLDKDPDNITATDCTGSKLRRVHSTSEGDSNGKPMQRSAMTYRQYSIDEVYHANEMDCLQAWSRLKLKLLDLNEAVQRLLLLIETHSSSEADLISEQTTLPATASSFKLSDKSVALTDREEVLGTEIRCAQMGYQLKGIVFPMAGAVLGGALGGPVGIVAGLKAAKMAAFSGGVLGLTGGSILKKRQPDASAVNSESLETSLSMVTLESTGSCGSSSVEPVAPIDVADESGLVNDGK